MRVVCMSDTHGLHDALLQHTSVPDGDVFVHAGDFTDTGDREEVLAFNAFLGRLPHRYKLVVAGNHECTFDRAFYPHNWMHYGHPRQYDTEEVRSLLTNALYLEDEAVMIQGYKFYGSPWQPEFCNWAFNLPRGEVLEEKWWSIPSDTDVLVTHTPPKGHGDKIGGTFTFVGDDGLLSEVVGRVRPQLHVFGHVHEGYGVSRQDGVTFVNASSCTNEYEAVNAPFVMSLQPPKSREGDECREYDEMLHQRLRMCSHKASMSRVVSDTDLMSMGGGRELRGFQVAGTTAGLLLESTLRVRPVVRPNSRALRYLFHHGFTPGGDEGEDNGEEEGGGDADADVEQTSTTGRAPLSRRATVAVLHEKEGSGEERSVDVRKEKVSGRDRRKMLSKRSGKSRLAPMIEEEPREEKAEEVEAKEAEEVVERGKKDEVECVLCKYKVPGHVHPGMSSVESSPAQVIPEVCSPEEEESKLPEEAEGQADRRAGRKTVKAKRLSSWF